MFRGRCIGLLAETEFSNVAFLAIELVAVQENELNRKVKLSAPIPHKGKWEGLD